MKTSRILTATALVAGLAVSTAYAQQQQQQTQRLNGTIERVDGNTIYAKGRDGNAITLRLADNATVTAVLKATAADIKLIIDWRGSACGVVVGFPCVARCCAVMTCSRFKTASHS